MKQPIFILIRIYQWFLSPALHTVALQFFAFPGCRYYPSCSQYAYNAIQRDGILKGVAKGLKRLCTCFWPRRGGYHPVSSHEL